MTRERLIGIAVGAATVVLTLLLLYALEGRSAQNPSQYPPLLHSEYDRRLDRLDRKGIESAYVARVSLLFQNWMTDTGKESAGRALKGHRNARQIYIDAMTELDHRDPEMGFKLQSSETSEPFFLPPLPPKQ